MPCPLTSEQEVLNAVMAGDLKTNRVPYRDFNCPVQFLKGSGDERKETAVNLALSKVSSHVLRLASCRHRIQPVLMPLALILAVCWLLSAGPTVAPTFLHRYVPELIEQPAEITSPTCHFRPIFGEGDSETRIVKGVARFGEVTVDPGGACELVIYTGEEQVYLMLEGEGMLRYGPQSYSVRKHDYMYLAPGIEHGISNPHGAPIRLLLFGYRLPAEFESETSSKLQRANLDDVPLQTVGGHPPDCQYRLLMGGTESKRDRLASAQILTSLFMMEFAPGGTNLPHHHEQEEEIYYVLSGEGEMVAGGGLDGLEGRHPARAGDAYFFRLNCTAGFYATTDLSAEKARILAARSLFPRRR